jgi:hypothetical protein
VKNPDAWKGEPAKVPAAAPRFEDLEALPTELLAMMVAFATITQQKPYALDRARIVLEIRAGAL